jgi:HAD superfamily hydrolase (TIGR01509 family)
METTEKTFRPSAVIFDMDGLMFDTEKPFIRLWSEIGKKYGYNIPRDVVMKMVGLNNDSSRIVMAQEYGEDFPYDKLREELRPHYNKEFENGIPHKKGLDFLLDRLSAAKIPMGVATSTRGTRAHEMLEQEGLLKKFTSVTSGDEIKRGKPAPDIFLLAAERLGQPPSACVGFEDSTAGLLGLHAAGIRSIFVKDLIEPPQEVLALVWRRCNDLAEAADILNLTNC